MEQDEHNIPVIYQNPATKRGGARAGAGAPQGNLNRIVHGGRSKQMNKAIEKLASDPELRPLLKFFIVLAARYTASVRIKER